MKTIEDRADIASDIAKREFEEDSYWSHYADDMVTSAFVEGCYKGYISGATEQKEIDIQKFISLIDSLNIDKLYMESRVLSDGSRIPNQEFITHIRKVLNN